MQSLTKHDIIGFLYYNDDGDLCVMNESGSYTVLIESEEPHLAVARSLTLTESQDVRWKNTGEVETWDAEILGDLVLDLTEEGRVPADEFSYENSKYSTIIISPG